MKDPFAKERAVFQAKKKPEKQPEPVDDFTLRFFKPLLASLKGDLEPLIKANKGEKGDTPIKGKDYFTKEEITAIKDEVLSRIPTPKDGKDAEVNYDLILAYVTEQVSKLPKAKDGEDGKDAVIDYAKVVADVLKEIPKTEKLTVDYTKIQELIDEKVKTIPWNEKRVVGYSSLKQLTDVILDGVPQDSKGNYILTPGGTGSGHTIEDEGTPLTQRDTLNFVGAGVTVTDAGGKTVVTIPGGGGAVDSVNGQTGVVVLDADDISDASTTNKFATAAEKAKLANITVTQAVDLDAIEAASHAAVTVTDSTSIDITLTGQGITAQREALTGAITAPKNSNTTSLGSFTKAQLDTAVSDGNVLYVGDVTQYTDELAQDATGAMASNSTFINLAYNDGTPSLTPALSATGTPSSSTFLRGDNTWATPAGGGGSFTWQGQWLTATSYVAGDIVRNGTAGYVCILANTSSATDEPGVGASWTTYWDLFVEDGAPGGSGISQSIVVTSGSFTAGATANTNYIYLIAGAHPPTLPTAVGNTNLYTFKNNHSADITVATTSSQTIDGTTTITISPEDSVTVVSTNANWSII